MLAQRVRRMGGSTREHGDRDRREPSALARATSARRRQPAELAAGRRARRQRRHRLDRRHRDGRRRRDHRPVAGPGRRRGRAGGGRAEHGRRRVRLGQHPADSEQALLDEEAASSRRCRRRSSRELAEMYERQGAQPRSRPSRSPRSSPSTTRWRAHAETEFGIDPDNLTNPWHAAFASMVAFTVGALLPLLTITLTPGYRPDLGDRARRSRSRWRVRPAGVSARLGYGPSRAGPCCATSGRPVRDGASPTRIGTRWSAPSSRPCASGARPMRMFVAVVPPHEAVEHLDEFLERAPRRGAVPVGAGRAAARHAGVPRRRARPAARRPGRSGSAARPPGVRPSRRAVAGGGAFPNAGRARVAVGRPRPRRARPHRADRLATGARAAASRAGIAGRRASGSGRTSPWPGSATPQEVTSWVRLLDAYRGPAWTVDRLTLVASYLGEGPRGRPRYELVEELRAVG